MPFVKIDLFEGRSEEQKIHHFESLAVLPCQLQALLSAAQG